jgi:hypothetical protein
MMEGASAFVGALRIEKRGMGGIDLIKCSEGGVRQLERLFLQVVALNMLAELFNIAGSCLDRGKKSEQTAQDA